MKVFISWSGARSRYIADTLRWWLPNVIQAAVPFVSNQDIRKGARGGVVISENLEQANVGIICLTPENQKAPWILFEAGALSKLSSAYLCTYLLELEPSNVDPPLGQFQHTRINQSETKELMVTINEQLSADRRLDMKRLDDAFETWWPKLDEKFKGVPPKPDGEPVPEKRTDDSKLNEILMLLRTNTIGEQSVGPDSSKSYIFDFLIDVYKNDNVWRLVPERAPKRMVTAAKRLKSQGFLNIKVLPDGDWHMSVSERGIRFAIKQGMIPPPQ